MIYSPFGAYYLARKLETLSDAENLISVFASSDIKVYPFQIAAARFVLRSPYQKGFILGDESGMGKSHEAMEVAASAVIWDLTLFEEATALTSVYMQENKKAKALKRIAKDSCKILLTGTPIEKNIMDLYGLIYFIDETILPTEQEFLRRYLRQPENYPELADKVSKYCFRTLRRQAKQYAQIPNRIPITHEYMPSDLEQQLYGKLFTYCQKEQSIAFPEMNAYDLSLRLLGLLGSSTAAILQTIEGIIKRIADNPVADDELQELRGFNLEVCSFVVQYDLLYNTLKMEQRIDRCHRLGQQNDVIALSFIDKNNFADVRKLELINKRMLVADGVLGLSDEVVGGFTNSLDDAFAALSQRLRSGGNAVHHFYQTACR